MSEGQVLIDVDARVATLTLDNPKRRNAISMPMWRAIADLAASPRIGTEIRAVIVRGAGTQAFSAGADISGFADARATPAGARSYDDFIEETCRAVEAMACPTIALIHGACFGAGASLASSCDLRLASAGATLAVPAARLGLGYDPRGVARFLRVYGGTATRYLLLSAERLPVERAASLGAVIEVAAVDEIEARAAALARQIAGNAPLTLSAAKAAIRAQISGEPGVMAEAIRLYEAADASEDYAEGRRAFAEKRAPRFEGR